MAKKKPEPQWTWAPSKTDKPKVPDDLKKEVQAKADDLVATGGGVGLDASAEMIDFARKEFPVEEFRQPSLPARRRSIVGLERAVRLGDFLRLLALGD